MAVTLPVPLPQDPLPSSAFVIYVGVWIPVLFIEVVAGDRNLLEQRFGPGSVREMRSIELELCRAIDVCLSHAERLLTKSTNGFVARGGERRRQDWSGYPVLRDDGTVHPQIGLEYPTVQCHFVALNLSKQDEPAGELDRGAPVPVATEVASRQMLVIVAAGNGGERDDLTDTRSPWARAEWVLPVGATEDEAGLRIASYSGRGAEGPQLVAWGASGLDESVIGTSFAAPRVTREALVLAACLHTLVHAVGLQRGDEVRGIPLVGLC